MNTDGSNVQQLTNEPNSQEQNPSWSPDGSKLVFERCIGGPGPVPWVCNTQWDLFVMNADGTNARNLTNTPNSDEWLGRFTADGRRIGFTTNRDGNNELYLMNADGTNPVNLTKNAARDVGLDFKP